MTTMTQLFDSSMYFGGNAPFVEELYENYLDNPGPSGRVARLFRPLAQMPGFVARDVPHAPVIAAFAELAKGWGFRPTAPAAHGRWQEAGGVLQLINAYRFSAPAGAISIRSSARAPIRN